MGRCRKGGGINMKTHLKAIGVFIALSSIFTVLCYLLLYKPLLGLIIILLLCGVVLYADIYKKIKDSENE